MATRCVNDVCVYKDVKCAAPIDEDPCVASLGCDAFSDQCRYERVSCDDRNPCTKDVCSRNNEDDGQVTCVHEQTDECEDTFGHSVFFDNNQDRELRISSNSGDFLTICHTTRILSASRDLVDPLVVIGFEEYERGSLHERGTCDNLVNMPTDEELHYRVAYITSAQPEMESSQCSQGHRPGLHLDGIFSELVWQEGDGASRLVDTEGGRLHMNARVEGEGSSAGFGFTVDAYFDRDFTYTPFRHLSSDCYDKMNIDVDGTWIGYKLVRGRLTALSKSLYDGLIIDLTDGRMQMGYGANGVSMNNGVWTSFLWTINHQPHDESLRLSDTSVKSGDFRGDLNLHLPQDTSNNVYCKMFDDQGESLLSDKLWKMEKLEGVDPSDTSEVKYCANFTVEDLLRCRDNVDKYAPLFTRTNDGNGLVYVRGELHHAVVTRPEDCSHPLSDTGESIWSRTSYDLALTLDANNATSNIVKINVNQMDVDFQLSWIENTWLCCTEEDAGNILVEIETRTQGHQLVDPRVTWYGESGVPLVFVQSDKSKSGCFGEVVDNVCVQRWFLRSYDSGNLVDFSGEHVLSWNTVDSGASAYATMHVFAKHVGNQDHLDNGRLSVTSGLYTNRAFTDVYDQSSGKKVDDKSHLFGLVCLDSYRHLDLTIQEVTVCYTNISPGELGINSLSCDQEGVEKVLIYSRDDSSITKQDFELLQDPPSTTHCEGFSFQVKAYSIYPQKLRIKWATQEVGGEGGLIEMYNDDGDDHHIGWHWQNDNSQGFSSRCANGWYYHQGYNECRPLEDRDESAVAWAIFAVVFLIGICVFSWSCCHDRFYNAIQPPQQLYYDNVNDEENTPTSQSHLRFPQQPQQPPPPFQMSYPGKTE